MKFIKFSTIFKCSTLGLLGGIIIVLPAQAFTLAGGIDLGSLGLPPNLNTLTDFQSIIAQPDQYFADFLPINLGNIEQILGNSLPLSIPDLETVFGEMGLPDTDALLREILGNIDLNDILGGSSDPENIGMPTTPGINPAIPAQVQTLAILTETSTAKFLSEAGQQLLADQVDQTQTSVQQIANFATLSADISDAQIQASETLASGVDAQTSTQETLKTGLSGLGALIAAQSNMQAIGNYQAGVSAQLDLAQYTLLLELGTQAATTNENLSVLNAQFNQMQQREMAADRSAVLGAARSLQGLRALY